MPTAVVGVGRDVRNRIAEALQHLPEKQLTGRNRLEGFETQISRSRTPSIT